jgi:nitroreductase
VIATVYERTRANYVPRTGRYAHMEVGRAAQNIYLQSESLGLGTVMGARFEAGRTSTRRSPVMDCLLEGKPTS